MSSAVASPDRPTSQRPRVERLRVAFLGHVDSLERSMPPATDGLIAQRFDCADDGCEPIDEAERFAADCAVILDPCAFSAEQLRALSSLQCVTLGVLFDGLPTNHDPPVAGALDRAVSFDPSLTGARLGDLALWRAIPPPVADDLFADVYPLHAAPRAMSIGCSTPHREAMLTPSKHEHDLLHVVHGLSGDDLDEVLHEYDVGIYVGRQDAPSFGWQVGLHLAAGHLLLAETLDPAHGLERNIDYLCIDSPGGLAWTLRRLRRFPEMHHRVRVRGRMKAEQFRASRLFARLLTDLLLDVRAFGTSRPAQRSG